MKNIANIYRLFYESKEKFDEETIREFFKGYRNDYEKNDIKVDSFLQHHSTTPDLIEMQLLKEILDVSGIEIDFDYLSLYTKELSALSVQTENDNLIIVDELFVFSQLTFFATVFSFVHDKQIKNYERCFKSFVVLLDLQGRRKLIGTFNHNELLKMLQMPEDILNLSMDAYWCAWTFVIGHELFHLMPKEKMEHIAEEYAADRFGYQLLLKMIDAQKKEELPSHLQVFYEDMYLAPLMLLEYYRLIDVYREIVNAEKVENDAFSSEKRTNRILSLFDELVPDSLDTEQGNELLNLFLDATEQLEEELKIKMRLGKLQAILDEPLN